MFDRHAITLLALLALLSAAPNVHAAEFYWGGSLGHVDIDREQQTSDDFAARFQAQSYSVFVGADLWKYLGTELHLVRIAEGSTTDADGLRSAFEAAGVTASILAQYPLAEDFRVFARVGAARMDYELSNADFPRGREGSGTRLVFGAGIKVGWGFVEYVNFEETDDFYLEQIRAGFRYEF